MSAMSKLSFRARALDASKSMPVYLGDEIPELPDFAAINRAVPQMPTGMEKEEETVRIYLSQFMGFCVRHLEFRAKIKMLLFHSILVVQFSFVRK
jgi:hypothetical protein